MDDIQINLDKVLAFAKSEGFFKKVGNVYAFDIGTPTNPASS